MVNRTARRRRQRAVRIGVAAALLGVASLVALPALVSQSPLWLSLALLFSLGCGATATRIVYIEVLQTRRAHAASLARQAVDYQILSTQRATENIAFSSTMARRVADRERSIDELEGTIRLAEKRATVAEIRATFETGRADEAVHRLAALQGELAAAETAGPAGEAMALADAELDTVVDLMNWEDRKHA